MQILLSNASSDPLYEQIYSQLVQQILEGYLPAEAPLPSIRHMASSLKISVITVKKAYDMLEEGGFIHTRPGVGCFVANAGKAMVQERLLNQAETAFEEGIRLANQAGLDSESILNLVSTLIQLGKEGGN